MSISVRRQLLSLILLLPVLIVGCGGSDDPTTPTTPTTPPPTGPATLQLTDLTAGTGDGLLASSIAIVHYTVWLYDPAGADSKGTRLGSSRDSPGTPLTFRLGTNAVIPGFEQSVQSMQVGGVRRAIIPPTLAYGSGGSSDGRIPGNSWLVFEIELIAVTN
jgi:FKBP-type peptidyl-prolyl cis-trans isomerase FkpA